MAATSRTAAPSLALSLAMVVTVVVRFMARVAMVLGRSEVTWLDLTHEVLEADCPEIILGYTTLELDVETANDMRNDFHHAGKVEIEGVAAELSN